MNKPELLSQLTGLAEMFDRRLSEAVIEGYWSALHDLTNEQLSTAVSKALRTCKYFPRPVELRELAGVAESQECEAMVAWETLCGAVERHGGYRSVDFADGRINAVVRHLGGWPRLCGMNADQFDTWLKKDFMSAWDAYRAAPLTEAQTASLPGIHDAQNRDGIKPVLVGGDSTPRIPTAEPQTAVAIVAASGRRIEMKRA